MTSYRPDVALAIRFVEQKTRGGIVRDAAALTVPPAGWYPDRSEANLLRWWDGQQWTDNTQSTAPAAAAFEQQSSAAAFGFVPPEQNPVVQRPAEQGALVAPGWYPDNGDPSQQRWW